MFEPRLAPVASVSLVCPKMLRQLSEAAQVTIWHADSGMARMSYAPGLILTAPYAVAPAIAVAVRAAAAQREGRCNRR